MKKSSSSKTPLRWNSTNKGQREKLLSDDVANSAKNTKIHQSVLSSSSSKQHRSLFGVGAVIAGSILVLEARDALYEDDFLSLRSTVVGEPTACSTASATTQPLLSLVKSTTFSEGSQVENKFPGGYDVSVRALKGNRVYMEDEYYVSNGGRFAAVFDGHGGGGVSAFLRDGLYGKISKHLTAHNTANQNNNTNKITTQSLCEEADDDKLLLSSSNFSSDSSLRAIVRSIRSAFVEVDDEILKMDDLHYQGSTALAIWLHENPTSGQRTLLSANIGDSRAVLSRNGRAVNLTRDHKPDDEIERKRLISLGEEIEWDDYCQVHRIRNLSLSRAVGDRYAKPAVSGEVEIQLLPLSESGEKKDKFVVLASDGLWDVMTSQECVDFIQDCLNDSSTTMRKVTPLERQRQKFARRKNMSRFVANEALRRGSGDNVCVIIVWLTELEKS